MKELTKAGLKMFKKLCIILFGSIILALSCKGQKHATTNDSVDTSSMELIMQENYSGSEVEETLIIKDRKSLEAFFGKINRTRKPGLPIPEIDFTTEMVLVWCAGEGTAIMPELAIAKETKEAYVLTKFQSSEKTKTFAVTSPFSVYKLPSSTKKVILE